MDVKEAKRIYRVTCQDGDERDLLEAAQNYIQALENEMHPIKDGEEHTLRVWWHRRYNDDEGSTSRIPVHSPEEAIRVIHYLTLNEVDDEMVYLNACGLEVLEDGDWVEWYDEDGDCIEDVIRARDMETEDGGK